MQAGIDAFRQPDVRRKILFTVAMLIVFRFVAHVPVPGVEREALRQTFDQNAILGFMNIFSGGALENLSVAALGVYPYITATIVMQLATPLVPRLQALSREGEAGRQRIQKYQHWLTVPLAAFQGYAQLLLIQQLGGVTNIGFTDGNALATVATIISMVAGTMFLVWLGELISENGIGNGVSLISFGGIVAGMPGLIGRGVLTSTSAAGGGLLLLASFVLTGAWSVVQAGAGDRFEGLAWLWSAGAVAIPVLLTFFTFLFLFWLLPHQLVRLRHIWPGALVAALGVEVVKQGFAFYLSNVTNYDVVYGSLGGVIALPQTD